MNARVPAFRLAVPTLVAALAACTTLPEPDLRVRRIEQAVVPMARAALAAGQVETARRLYTRLLDVAPETVDARMGLGDVALATDRPARAARWYLDAAGLAQGRRARHAALLAHGRAAIAAGDLDGARRSFEGLVSPEERAQAAIAAWGHNGLAVVAMLEGDPLATVAAVEQAVLLDPDEPRFRGNLARAVKIADAYRVESEARNSEVMPVEALVGDRPLVARGEAGAGALSDGARGMQEEEGPTLASTPDTDRLSAALDPPPPPDQAPEVLDSAVLAADVVTGPVVAAVDDAPALPLHVDQVVPTPAKTSGMSEQTDEERGVGSVRFVTGVDIAPNAATVPVDTGLALAAHGDAEAGPTAGPALPQGDASATDDDAGPAPGHAPDVPDSAALAADAASDVPVSPAAVDDEPAAPLHDDQAVRASEAVPPSKQADEEGVADAGSLASARDVAPTPPATPMDLAAATQRVAASRDRQPEVVGFLVQVADGEYLQVGAFAVEANARRLAERLAHVTELPVGIVKPGDERPALHRVRIGPLPSRSELPLLLHALRLGVAAPARRAASTLAAGQTVATAS